jgi:hypothetical protein
MTDYDEEQFTKWLRKQHPLLALLSDIDRWVRKGKVRWTKRRSLPF